MFSTIKRFISVRATRFNSIYNPYLSISISTSTSTVKCDHDTKQNVSFSPLVTQPVTIQSSKCEIHQNPYLTLVKASV